MRTRLLCCLMLLMCLSASQGQYSGNRPTPQPVDPLPAGMRNEKEHSERPSEQEVKQTRARQGQQYKDLKRDTDKLLELATELKQQVDRSDQHTLSLQVIKKAAEIEKLAHAVRNRMKGD